MRTKTILLIGAVVAAGAGTSMAQVFSVNAVGYVNKTIPANGFALISNPLRAATNDIKTLFAGVPAGFRVFKYTPGTGYRTTQLDDLTGEFDPADVAALTVEPGEGVFVQNPTAAPVTVTFVGEVMQGTDLSIPLVAGFQIVSSKVPQAGTIAQLGYQGVPGDKVYQFNAATQAYYTSGFDDLVNDWDPALRPLEVGEAVFLEKTAPGTWTRSFNVNQPN